MSAFTYNLVEKLVGKLSRKEVRFCEPMFLEEQLVVTARK
jgi:hypothetical protein